MNSFVASFFSLICVLSFIDLTGCVSLMSVDIGSEWIKIGVVSPGVPMEIVLNKESKRKTPFALSFRNGEREFGEDAITNGIRSPESTFRFILDLVGKEVDHPLVQKFQHRFPQYNIIKDPTRNTVVFKLDEENHFTPEELIAMVLTKCRHYAQEFTGQVIRDVVITVPSYFNQVERQSILNSAELSGLKVLQLINDNTAIALNYGVFRRNDFNNTMQKIMFYDIGSSSTTATIVGYQVVKTKERGFTETNPQLSVLGVGYDRTLGGLEITFRLRDHLVKVFNEQKKTKKDIGQDRKAMAKLLKEAERVKMVLSANTEHLAQIEGLIDDKDFKTLVTRAEVEEMSMDLFERVGGPVNSALKAAAMTLDDIDQVILVGAGTRVAKVQEKLQEVTKRSELGKNLNTDEAAALGAVYQAANLGQGFKVKKFLIKDAVLYPIQVDFERDLPDEEGGGTKSVSRMLFAHMNHFPQKKVITFNRHTSDFDFRVNYGEIDYLDKEHLSYLGKMNLTKVELSGVADAISKHASDAQAEYKGVKAHFRIDHNGILQLDATEVVFDKKVNETDDDESTLSKLGSTISKLFSGSADADLPPLDAPDEPEKSDTDDTVTPSSNDTFNNTASQNATVNETQTAKNETAKPKIKNIIAKEPVKRVDHHLNIISLTAESIKESLKKIKVFDDLDQKRHEQEESKNALESFILDLQNKLFDEYEKLSTEDERTNIQTKLSAASDWLYEDGENAEAKVYKEKLKELQGFTASLLERAKENKDRPEAVQALVEMLNRTETFYATIKNVSADDQYFTETELSTFETLINGSRDWLKEKVAEQEKAPLYEAPRLTQKMIAEKYLALDREVKYLINKARTSKPKKPKVKATKEEFKAEGEKKVNETAGPKNETETVKADKINEDGGGEGRVEGDLKEEQAENVADDNTPGDEDVKSEKTAEESDSTPNLPDLDDFKSDQTKPETQDSENIKPENVSDRDDHSEL